MSTAAGAQRLALSAIEGRATITVDEYAEVMGLSRDTAYKAARTGEVPTIRVGRRILVPVPALLEQLGAKQPVTSAPVLAGQSAGA